MSGPKLSEYELEQLRKAELERIQREISSSQAHIKRLQQKATDEVKWCDQQLLQIERQLNLLASSTLSDGETSGIKQAILSQRQSVLDLKNAFADFCPSYAAQSDSLSDVQAEENRLQNILKGLEAEEFAISGGSSEYLEALRLLADNVKGGLTCSTYSLAEAMQNVAGKVSIDGGSSAEADKLRLEMLSRIAALKAHKQVTKKMVERLDHAVKLVEQESTVTRLKEINSLVIKDISRKLEGIEAQLDAYWSALCKNRALRVALNEDVDETEETFETPNSIKARTTQLIAENASLHERIIDVAERAEIEKSIDIAMDSLGYQLIGARGKTSGGSVKLYKFTEGVGIQLTQRDDGVVRMKVVGIGSAGDVPDEANKAYLLKMQEEFCGTYGAIVDAFAKQGVRQVQGTERKLPPDLQFAQMVDVSDYDPEFLHKKTRPDTRNKNRISVHNPVHLTSGE